MTGAGRGLGRQVAIQLTQTGYSIAGCSRTKFDLDTLRNVMFHMGRKSLVDVVDVRDYKQIQAFCHEVQKTFGPVDVLVNNAGVVHPRKPVQDIRHEDFDPAFETHFCGPLAFIEVVLPGMLERKSGVIVNVASKAARYAVPGFAAYNASKAALVSLTQTVAKEVEGRGVRVYSVSPGGMWTRLREEAYGTKKITEDVASGLVQDPKVVADVVTDLVRDGIIPSYGVKTEGVFTRREGPVKGRPDYAEVVPSGADVLVWKGGITVYPMEDVR